MTEVDFNNLEARTKPRDLAWENWKKWNQIGDTVQGYIRDVFFREAEGDFDPQRGLTIEQTDGELINVAIKHLDFILTKTNDLRLGDPVKIVYEKDLPAKQKHHSPTKQFAYYGSNLPENANNKTVLDLENEDRKLVEAAAAEKEASEAQKNAEFEGTATPAAAAPASELPFESNAAPAPVATPAPAPAPEAAAPASVTEAQAAPAAPAAPVAPVAPGAAPTTT